MAKIGTIYLQAQDKTDVCLSVDLFEDGVTDSSEQQAEVVEPDFGQFEDYLQGRVPGYVPIEIDGDSAVINGWLKEDQHPFPYRITIYLEYEEQDSLEDGGYPSDAKDKRCRVL